MNTLEYSGHSTLEHLAEARALNQWMYDTIKPYLVGTVFEFGSGTGTFSEFALQDYPCYLSDYEQAYCDTLDQRFHENQNYRAALRIDLNASLKAASPSVQALQGSIDTIFAINVLEHIRDHDAALELMHSLLKPGGSMVLFIPAWPALFNHLDTAFGHERRYTKQALSDLVARHSMKLTSIRYFNPLGIPGWFLLGSLLRKKTLPRSSIAVYEHILPLAKFIDRICSPFIGLSLIIRAEKK